ATGAAGGEDERAGEHLGADGDGAAVVGVAGEDEAVVVTVHGVGRVGARAFAARLSHDELPPAMNDRGIRAGFLHRKVSMSDYRSAADEGQRTKLPLAA